MQTFWAPNDLQQTMIIGKTTALNTLVPFCLIITNIYSTRAFLHDFDKIGTEPYYARLTTFPHSTKCFCKPNNRTDLERKQSIVHLKVTNYLFWISAKDLDNIIWVYIFLGYCILLMVTFHVRCLED